MMVWLWDADRDARRSRGVARDEQRAMAAAGQCILAGAPSARVEAARITMEQPALSWSYERTGTGWQGRRHGRGVKWEPLAGVTISA